MTATPKTTVRVHDDGNFVENRKRFDESLQGPHGSHKTTSVRGGRVEVDDLTPDEMRTWIYLRGLPATVVGDD